MGSIDLQSGHDEEEKKEEEEEEEEEVKEEGEEEMEDSRRHKWGSHDSYTINLQNESRSVWSV